MVLGANGRNGILGVDELNGFYCLNELKDRCSWGGRRLNNRGRRR